MKNSVNQNIPAKKLSLNYSWLVLAATTLTMLGFYGAELSFGVFLKPILEEFGWTRATVSAAISVVEGIAGILGIFVGRMTDKYGARWVIIIGSLLGGSGYILMYYLHSLWQLYIYFGLLVGFCMGACWTSLIATVSRWFVEKRVLAVGILTSGLTVGNMLMPPFMAYFIGNFGWRNAYLLLALIVVIVAIPSILLLGKNPPRISMVAHIRKNNSEKATNHVSELVPSREWSAMEAIKTSPIWILMIVGLVTSIGFFFMTVHIVPYATDAGITVTLAALIISFMSAGNISGKLLVWQIVNKIGNKSTLLLVLALEAIALFLLMNTKNLWMLLALGTIFGFGFGATMPVRMSMIPEYYGTKSLGTLVGLVSIAWAIGGIIGPIIAGYIFDLSGSYNIAFLSGIVLMVLGMIATLFLRPVSIGCNPR